MIDKNWEARCLKARKKRDKLAGMIEYLSERDMEAQGGYYAHRWVGKMLVIAGINEAKKNADTKDDWLPKRRATKLELFKQKELLRWFDRARKFYKIAKGATGFIDSLSETARPRKKITTKPVRKKLLESVK